jgi:Bacterial protein of unknown function (DUF899)
MTRHKTGTGEEWLAARLELLEAEKALTRRSDELARRRQELPWIRIDKQYRFETDEGSASLADLFRGRSRAPPSSVRLRRRLEISKRLHSQQWRARLVSVAAQPLTVTG